MLITKSFYLSFFNVQKQKVCKTFLLYVLKSVNIFDSMALLEQCRLSFRDVKFCQRCEFGEGHSVCLCIIVLETCLETAII